MKKVVPILVIMTGLYWVIKGYAYGFWVRNGPGGGFLPIVAGLMAIVFSLAVLWKDRKEKTPSDFTWLAFLPAAALLGMVFFSYLVGILISMAVYIFLWLKLIEKRKLSSSLAISFGTVGVIYGLFVVWLKVPLPKGLLGLL